MKNKTYSLPDSLTAAQILALSMGAFADHSFTSPATGEHITCISEHGMQLRKGDGTPRNVSFKVQPAALQWPFTVKFYRDPTW